MNYSLDSLFHALMNDFNVLSEKDRVDLIRPISKIVVYPTFKSMPPGKTPSPDGLNVEFYIFIRILLVIISILPFLVIFFLNLQDSSFLG